MEAYTNNSITLRIDTDAGSGGVSVRFAATAELMHFVDVDEDDVLAPISSGSSSGSADGISRVFRADEDGDYVAVISAR